MKDDWLMAYIISIHALRVEGDLRFLPGMEKR